MNVFQMYDLSCLLHHFETECLLRDISCVVIGDGKVFLSRKKFSFIIIKEKGNNGKTYSIVLPEHVTLGSSCKVSSKRGKTSLKLIVSDFATESKIQKHKDGSSFRWYKSLVYELKAGELVLITIN